MDEMYQIHTRYAFRPKLAKHLIEEQKRDKPEYIMFLNFNRDNIVRGQTCADGQKQCKKSVPGYATTPTVSTESVLIKTTIEAHEGRNIEICDIRGAFISAYMV